MIVRNETIEDLRQRIRGRDVVCWGTGTYLTAFLDSVKEHGEEPGLLYLVDNNKKLHHKVMRIGKRDLRILSAGEFIENWQNEILIITTVHYQAILKQLGEYPQAMGKDSVIYPLIKNHAPKKSISIKRSEIPGIPRKIHYCWFGGNPIPTYEKSCIRGWRELCPDYELVLWNEKNFDCGINDYVKWAYQNKKWAFVSDYARMYAVYREGGFYFDTDVEMLKSPEELRYQEAFMAMEEAGCVNSGLGMGAAPGNPVLGKLLARYDAVSAAELTEQLRIVPNSVWETDLLREYGFRANNHYQVVENIALFPSTYFMSRIPGAGEMTITEMAYSIHRPRWSWLEAESRNQMQIVKGDM